MKNLHPYNQEKFQLEFETTDTFKKLKETYQYIFFDKFLEPKYMSLTPRHRLSLNWASATSWYYLNWLDTETEIFDLGCGMNFFKPYFPRLVGVGAEDNPELFFGDVHDYVDDGFYQGHVNAYKSVFSINALHFRPLETLRNICIQFSQMIKPGGKGYLALNAARMYENSLTLRHSFKITELDNWIRTQFDDFPCKIAVLDIDLSVPDASLDGNIRVVFEK